MPPLAHALLHATPAGYGCELPAEKSWPDIEISYGAYSKRFRGTKTGVGVIIRSATPRRTTIIRL